jgi:subtilisin family serine protease
MLGLLVVQVWHQHEDNIRVQLRSPNGELFEPPLNGTEEFDRGVLFVEANHQVAAYSGDHVTTFTIVTVPQPQWLSGWSIIATESQPGGVRVGTVHSWILNRGMGEFTEGATRSHLVGMPGTAFSAVTVASYATRKEWTSADPNNRNVVLDAVNLEEISYFSSPGPTRDGHNKPEIAAPGQWLISALSGDASTTEIPLWTRVQGIKYTAMQGTSMSAPYVTGSLALLLQKHPTMDWAEAKRRLMKSAKQDASTQPCWNNRWGYGKLDVDRLLNIEP